MQCCLKIFSFREQAFWHKFDQNSIRSKKGMVVYIYKNCEHGYCHFEYFLNILPPPLETICIKRLNHTFWKKIKHKKKQQKTICHLLNFSRECKKTRVICWSLLYLQLFLFQFKMLLCWGIFEIEQLPHTSLTLSGLLAAIFLTLTFVSEMMLSKYLCVSDLWHLKWIILFTYFVFFKKTNISHNAVWFVFLCFLIHHLGFTILGNMHFRDLYQKQTFFFSKYK